DHSWRDRLPRVRAVVSCLAIHHLDGREKRELYRDLREHLVPGGALIIADLVAPTSERQRRQMADGWDEAVRRQSLESTGSHGAYEEFIAGESNIFRYPDPMDTPSTLPDHLRWLDEAGFDGANVYWARAGHAVYGATASDR
ncbi:MAG: class I SAM-dependent methyltransferase, partial [Chloroflexota bacterium]